MESSRTEAFFFFFFLVAFITLPHDPQEEQRKETQGLFLVIVLCQDFTLLPCILTYDRLLFITYIGFEFSSLSRETARQEPKGKTWVGRRLNLDIESLPFQLDPPITFHLKCLSVPFYNPQKANGHFFCQNALIK